MEWGWGLLYLIMPPFSDECAFLRQRLHHLFHKERRAVGLLENEVLQRREARSVPQQNSEEGFGFGFAQSRQVKLGIVGLLSPLMAILRAVVDQQQNPRIGDTLTERIEKPLHLIIYPVQVFKDENEGPVETLAQE